MTLLHRGNMIFIRHNTIIWLHFLIPRNIDKRTKGMGYILSICTVCCTLENRGISVQYLASFVLDQIRRLQQKVKEDYFVFVPWRRKYNFCKWDDYLI